jgi:hypothetical protein
MLQKPREMYQGIYVILLQMAAISRYILLKTRVTDQHQSEGL